jgi:hypothetical protein
MRLSSQKVRYATSGELSQAAIERAIELIIIIRFHHLDPSKLKAVDKMLITDQPKTSPKNIGPIGLYALSLVTRVILL